MLTTVVRACAEVQRKKGHIYAQTFVRKVHIVPWMDFSFNITYILYTYINCVFSTVNVH